MLYMFIVEVIKTQSFVAIGVTLLYWVLQPLRRTDISLMEQLALHQHLVKIT